MLDAQSQKSLDELKQLVSQLYLHLNVNQYEIEREQNVIKQLESYKNELQPMEKVLVAWENILILIFHC